MIELGKLLFAIIATFFVFVLTAMTFFLTGSIGFGENLSGFQLVICAVIALAFFGLVTRSGKSK